ncbi:unnamed protein product [Cuscuta campestris]|uniref:Uncharacterized protein n=1 Tax=Cuscuta campestris TaxID=132261 RepID=A0A484N847_9ASTE|nr:unnamed protein product [Cuscuta campestris]
MQQMMAESQLQSAWITSSPVMVAIFCPLISEPSTNSRLSIILSPTASAKVFFFGLGVSSKHGIVFFPWSDSFPTKPSVGWLRFGGNTCVCIIFLGLISVGLDLRLPWFPRRHCRANTSLL